VDKHVDKTTLLQVLTEEQFKIGTFQTAREILEQQAEIIKDYSYPNMFLSAEVQNWMVTRACTAIASVCYQLVGLQSIDIQPLPAAFDKSCLMVYDAVQTYLHYMRFIDIDIHELKKYIRNIWNTSLSFVFVYGTLEGGYNAQQPTELF
jgi:hypothetical protein